MAGEIIAEGYTVMESPRAKRVRLEMSLLRGVVLIVPRGFDQHLLPEIIGCRKHTIARGMARLDYRRAVAGAAHAVSLPVELNLRAVGEHLAIDYRAESRVQRVRVMEIPGGRLQVVGAVDDHAACLTVLRTWVKRRAEMAFMPWLRRLARESGFSYRRVTIRSQRTRWGSCSSRGTVSLNCRLLFLQSELAEYVMLHELCHTVRMDHSRAFWGLLERCDPDCSGKRKALRKGWQQVPGWF